MDSFLSFGAQTVVELASFNADDPWDYHTGSDQDMQVLAQLKPVLERRGWAFVKLPPKIVEAQKLHLSMRNFFALSQQEKNATSLPPQFGYSKVDHKEGFRVVSHRLPTSPAMGLIFEDLNSTLRTLDDISLLFAAAAAQALFGRPSSASLALHADLPVAYTQHMGMLDIALYHNKLAGQRPPAAGESVDEVNCVPHVDPGLLSLSFWSDAEGLQLWDPTEQKWFAGPVNTIPGQEHLGVLWLGTAAEKASQGKLRAGVHRVIYPARSGPRMTIWYEMCTVEQVNGPDDSPAPSGEVSLPNVRGPGQMLYLAPGESQMSAKRRIERTRGLPMSKVPRLADDFKSEYEPDFDSAEKKPSWWDSIHNPKVDSMGVDAENDYDKTPNLFLSMPRATGVSQPPNNLSNNSHNPFSNN